MKKLLLALATLLLASTAYAQTQPLTQPEVLGCTNPAPAAAGQATVFISACKTPAFLPLTTTSVVASVSKTAPVFAHTLSGYQATDKLVACPIGATVSGATCTLNGADVSALVAQSSVSTFTVAPPPTVQGTLTWTAPTANDDGSTPADVVSYQVYEDQTQIGTTTSSVLSYSLGTLNQGDTHVFGVAALSSGGIQSSVTTINYTVPVTVVKPKTPNPPTNLTVTVK
jgi:hypothetical protein